MKRFWVLLRVSDERLDQLGAPGTGEEQVAGALKAAGLEPEEIEGLDWWPDPKPAEAPQT